MLFTRAAIVSVAAGVLAFAPAEGARANDAADFFNGRTITVVVGYGPAGGYAVYCRQLTAYFGRHIPGNPTVTCQFMPGQGGVKAATYLHSIAPRDGTVLGMISDYAAIAQLMQPERIKYEIRDFRWVGVMVPSNPLLTVHRDAGITSFDQLFEEEMTIGVTGVLAQSGINSRLMNAFLGTKIRIIAGYESTGKVALAMEQGEVDSTMSSWISLKARALQKFESGEFIPLLQVGFSRAKDLPEVPLMSDYAKDEQARQVAAIASASAPFGRSVVVVPEYPDHLLAALREAFAKTMEDEEFLKTARERNIDIDPAPGESVEPVLEQVMNTPPHVVKLVQEAAGLTN